MIYLPCRVAMHGQPEGRQLCIAETNSSNCVISSKMELKHLNNLIEVSLIFSYAVSSCRSSELCSYLFAGEKNEHRKYRSSLLFISELSAFFPLHRHDTASIEAGFSGATLVLVANANLR